MAYLQKSTHFNNWIFSESELQRIHRLRQLKATRVLRLEHQQALSAKAAAASDANGAGSTSRAVAARKPRSFAALVPKSTTAVRDVNDWNDEIYDDVADLDAAEAQEAQECAQLVPPLALLTIDQERVLREFYEVKVQESCTQLFRTSDKVKCCAVMLYKRFYLSNSVMEFHPKFIVPTAIYVAGKIEEQYISVDTIAEQLHVDHKHVIGHEMILLEGTRFQLIMYHPFRALWGFVDDFRGFTKAKGKELPLNTLQKLHSNSCVVVNDLLLTDLPLTYYPPYLALAALSQVVQELGESSVAAPVAGEEIPFTKADVHEYIRRSKFSQGQQISEVTKQLDAICNIYTALKAKQSADKEPAQAEALAKQVKSLYKKLKSFHEDDEKSGGKDKKKKDDKKRKSGKKDDKKKAKKAKKEKK
uniref:Cyclin-like domain-containing protein n=1 Tax=Globisporangium ultimum (strain ATCC 200006 / CBS 805.95 / DAOM BR144) TaxID=431595 RepID=K3WG18_GLOUD